MFTIVILFNGYFVNVIYSFLFLKLLYFGNNHTTDKDTQYGSSENY